MLSSSDQPDDHDHDVGGDFGTDYDVHGYWDEDGCDGHDIGVPEDVDD